MNLYEKNPCELPCWWGIIPGKTDWREAWQFLERFAINEPPWDNLLLESKNLPGYMYFQAFLDVPQTPEDYYYSSLNQLVLIINISTFKVRYIDVNTGNISAYTIPRILQNYGEPEEIFVMIGGGQVSQYSGVTLFLYYPQFGFISSHFFKVDQEEWNEPTFSACYQKVTELYLWPQKEQLGFDERLIISGYDAVDSSILSLFEPINQVSELTVRKFYQSYVNLQELPCIEFNSPGQQ
jgi:hypothetical protein